MGIIGREEIILIHFLCYDVIVYRKCDVFKFDKFNVTLLTIQSQRYDSNPTQLCQFKLNSMQHSVNLNPRQRPPQQ
jgi:hypothetical protein